MNQTYYYKKAIQMVFDGFDIEETCINIAKNNPKVFCDNVTVDKINENLVKKEALSLYGSKGRVAAVKHIRNVMEIGLKEALDKLNEWLS